MYLKLLQWAIIAQWLRNREEVRDGEDHLSDYNIIKYINQLGGQAAIRMAECYKHICRRNWPMRRRERQARTTSNRKREARSKSSRADVLPGEIRKVFVTGHVGAKNKAKGRNVCKTAIEDLFKLFLLLFQ